MLVALLLSLIAHAQAAEMETDRPDRTESTVTVEQGRSQIEFEAASFKRGAKKDELSVGAFEARYGISESADVQVQFSPFLEERNGTKSSDGVGDTVLRVKMNLFGDKPDTNGIAIMPYVKLPTATDGNGKVEGGLILPMRMMLPSELELSFQLEASAVRTEDNSDEVAQFITSYSLGHKIAGDFDGYVEFYSESEPSADWIATVDTGITYKIDDNDQLDAGVNIGASPAADPFNPFVGYSVRF